MIFFLFVGTLICRCSGITDFRYNQVAYGIENKKVVVALRDEKIKGGAYFLVEEATTGLRYFSTQTY